MAGCPGSAEQRVCSREDPFNVESYDSSVKISTACTLQDLEAASAAGSQLVMMERGEWLFMFKLNSKQSDAIKINESVANCIEIALNSPGCCCTGRKRGGRSSPSRISPESNCVGKLRSEQSLSLSLDTPSDTPISAAHRKASNRNRSPTGRIQTDTQLVKTEKLKSKELRN